VIFQVISTVVRIYLLYIYFPFTEILKQMVTNVHAECEEVSSPRKKQYRPHIC